jgi:hypothetical protein
VEEACGWIKLQRCADVDRGDYNHRGDSAMQNPAWDLGA